MNISELFKKVSLYFFIFAIGGICVIGLFYQGYISIGSRHPLPKANIAVVNILEIDKQSLASQSLQQLIQTETDKFHDLIDAKYKDATLEHTRIRELKKEGKTSEEQLRSMKDALTRKIAEIDKDIQKQKAELDTIFKNKLNEISTHIKNIIDTIRIEDNYDVVFAATIHDQLVALSSKDHIDITDQVIEALNKKISKVSLDG